MEVVHAVAQTFAASAILGRDGAQKKVGRKDHLVPRRLVVEVVAGEPEQRSTCPPSIIQEKAQDSLDKRASKAPSLVKLGELSAARVSLEGAEVAPGTLTTLRELTNPERRPPIPRQELSQEIARSDPAVPFDLDVDEFLIGLPSARRRAAGGPSGMTSEHPFPLLDSERDSSVLTRVATFMARGEVPASGTGGHQIGATHSSEEA